MRSPSGHPRCRWVCFFIRFVEMPHFITCSPMDPLQWNGLPSEWESKQLIKHHNNPQVIHTTPVHQFMFWEVKAVFLRNKSIIKTVFFSTSNHCFRLKYESMIHNNPSSIEKVHLLLSLTSKSTYILLEPVWTVLACKQCLICADFSPDSDQMTPWLSVTEALWSARAESKSSVLILLDLSAAFDNVNHQILLSTSYRWTSPNCTPLVWVLTSQVLRGSLGRRGIQITSTGHWVPQGSVLGPLRSLYTLNHWVPSFRNMFLLPTAMLMTRSFTFYFNQMIQQYLLGSQTAWRTSQQGWKNSTCSQPGKDRASHFPSCPIITAPVTIQLDFINNNPLSSARNLGMILEISWPLKIMLQKTASCPGPRHF